VGKKVHKKLTIRRERQGGKKRKRRVVEKEWGGSQAPKDQTVWGYFIKRYGKFQHRRRTRVAEEECQLKVVGYTAETRGEGLQALKEKKRRYEPAHQAQGASDVCT